MEEVPSITGWFDSEFFELGGCEREEGIPRWELGGVLVQAAPDQGQERRNIGHEGARLRYRMGRSGLVQISDLGAVEKAVVRCEKTQ